MLTEILRREPSALGLDGARGRLRCATAARPHPFSLVVRTCRPVGKRGGALLRICPPLVYLIIDRMLARPAFADSIKCSPSPWADKSSISRSRGSAPSYFPLRKSRFFRRFPLVTRGGKSGKISRFFFEPKSLPQFVLQNLALPQNSVILSLVRCCQCFMRRVTKFLTYARLVASNRLKIAIITADQRAKEQKLRRSAAALYKPTGVR
jgi:hypothetical protein